MSVTAKARKTRFSRCKKSPEKPICQHSRRPARAAILSPIATPATKGQPVQNLDNIDNNAQLTIAELETSAARKRRGLTRLSASQIRRLESRGLFPQSRQITGTRSRFYVAGEIKAWLQQQAEGQA
nr:MAG TPA: terminase small subunit [Caudoviricetes sp.]